jgi:hypothetical protein
MNDLRKKFNTSLRNNENKAEHNQLVLNALCELSLYVCKRIGMCMTSPHAYIHVAKRR